MPRAQTVKETRSLESYRNSGKVEERIFAAIMDGSNKEAYEILRKVGDFKVIPGTYFTNMRYLSKFYGVTEPTLGLALRILDSHDFKDDVFFVKGEELAKELKARGVECEYDWSFKHLYHINNVGDEYIKELTAYPAFRCISAKTALGLALLHNNRKAPNAKFAATLKTILKNPTYKAAILKKRPAPVAKAEAPIVVDAPIPTPQLKESVEPMVSKMDAVTVSQADGAITLTPGFFRDMVAAIVGSTISALQERGLMK